MNAKQAAKRSGIAERLIRAVINQLHCDDGELESTLEDIRNHGIDGGFHGFIYYTDTVQFFKHNRALIVELVNDMANELGENAADMVAGFGCLAGRDMRGKTERDKRALLNDYLPSVYRCL